MKAPPEIHDRAVKIESSISQSLETTKLSSDRRREVRVLRTLEQIRAMRPVWETLLSHSSRRASIEIDFDRYVSTIQSNPEYTPYTLLFFEGGVPRTMLIGTRGPIKINCQLGYLNVFKPSLVGIKITYGGYLGDCSEQTSRRLMDYLYGSMCESRTDVIRFEQLPLQSPLYPLARKCPSMLCRSYFPKLDAHWQIHIPGRMESFYALHSSKTRQTLRRQIRKPEKMHRVHIAECTDSEAMQKALPIAAGISKLTYQYALGWGLMDDDATRRQLQAAAQSGWLRLHILYLDDAPCAFQLGFQSQGTYYLRTMGFDPNLGKLHIGTVLFLKIIEQLCDDPGVNRFDFGYGDAEYKRRFATEHWDEATLYMFAPRIYPVFVNLVRTAVRGLSAGMQCVVSKAGIEGQLKQKWRRRLRK